MILHKSTISDTASVTDTTSVTNTISLTEHFTLSVQHGHFSYPGSRQILQDINFQVSSGDLLAILGPNGAGKTTMLRCIMGFLKWNQGKSCLNGQSISTIPYNQLWQQMAYVPQAKTTTASYTVFDMILLGRSSHLTMLSHPTAKDLEKADEIMEQLGITALKHQSCSKLSGGELQMVLIARALAAEPSILILDEPESYLDFKNQLIVLDTMSQLAANHMTCIFNTHFPAHALQRANKSLILSKNGSYIFGKTESTVTEETIEKAFGVSTVIGELQTPSGTFRDIIPIGITTEDTKVSYTMEEMSNV